MPSRATVQQYRFSGPILMIGSLFFFYMYYVAEVRTRQLKSDGIVVPGEEVRRYIETGSKGSKSYRIVVNYTPTPLPEISNKVFSVPRPLYEGLGPGPGLRVRYFRGDPKIAEIVGAEQSPVILAWGGLGFLVLGGAITYAAYGNPPAWFFREK